MWSILTCRLYLGNKGLKLKSVYTTYQMQRTKEAKGKGQQSKCI